jgi:hypothetical protein
MSPPIFSVLSFDPDLEDPPVIISPSLLSRSVRLRIFWTIADRINARIQPMNKVPTAPIKLGKKAPTVPLVCLTKFSTPDVEKFGAVGTAGAA